MVHKRIRMMEAREYPRCANYLSDVCEIACAKHQHCALQNAPKCLKMLQKATKSYKMLQNATKCYTILQNAWDQSRR